MIIAQQNGRAKVKASNLIPSAARIQTISGKFKWTK